MPSSSRQSWWARHCTPPPPISAASSCPCGACFSKTTQDAAQLQIQHLQLQVQLQQQQQQQDQAQAQVMRPHKTQRSGKAWGEKPMRMMGPMASLLKKDSDSVSISSSISEGSIYHLEHAADH